MKVRNGKKDYHKKQKCCYRDGRKKDRSIIQKQNETEENKEDEANRKKTKEELEEPGGLK